MGLCKQITRNPLRWITRRWPGLRQLRHRGFAGNLRWLRATLPYHLWLHLLPSGRRELRFDAFNRVHTNGIEHQVELDIPVPLERRGEIVPHSPTMPWRFLSAMTRAVQVDYRHFVFVDVGCGKGRALLLAARFPFKRIVGVELSPALVEIARANVSRHGPRCEVICADACSYDLPPVPLVLYLFNPFVGSLFDCFVSGIEKSVRAVQRPVYIIYNNPVCEARLAASPLFVRLAGSREFFPRLAGSGELFVIYAHLNA